MAANTGVNYVWFCRDCKTKGDMLGNDDVDLFIAERQHKICSPNCGGLLRFVTKEELKRISDKEILRYVDWAD